MLRLLRPTHHLTWITHEERFFMLRRLVIRVVLDE